MKQIIFFLLSVIYFNPIWAQEETSAENEEPTTTFTLTINGQAFMLSEGEALRLDSTFSQPTISIRQNKHRTLKTGFISFNYPSHMSYQYEEDFAYKCWTLDGNDFVIIVFAFAIEMDMDEFIDSMIEEFGEENCQVGPTRIELGDQLFKGKKIKANLIGTEIGMDVLKIPSSTDVTRILVFQDTKEDDGSATEEGKEVLRMLDGTIVVVGKGS